MNEAGVGVGFGKFLENFVLGSIRSSHDLWSEDADVSRAARR